MWSLFETSSSLTTRQKVKSGEKPSGCWHKRTQAHSNFCRLSHPQCVFHTGGGFTIFQWVMMCPSVCPHCIYKTLLLREVMATVLMVWQQVWHHVADLSSGQTPPKDPPCYFNGQCEQVLQHNETPVCCRRCVLSFGTFDTIKCRYCVVLNTWYLKSTNTSIFLTTLVTSQLVWKPTTDNM